ncbi:50S ribosomal protein L34 [Candidatus Berkelbacteria bacterium]|nr:50S ribosomal protein L34 [Candidatus Berkelbacteria bacterium]
MKRTLQRNKRKRQKTHGFFSRKFGKVLKSRRAKLRARLSA